MSEGIRRRDFLKVVGAGGAGATVLGCSTQKIERLLPYVVADEEITPGVATWYTSVCGECPAGCGVLVRTREGRVVKVEGNPQHPISKGALCPRGYASVQGLYDPDRLRTPLLKEGGGFRPLSWDEAETLLAQKMAEGGRTLFLTGRLGPSMEALVEALASSVQGQRVEYESLSEAPLREATRLAFGVDDLPTYHLDQARLIYSFGADFLETWLSPVAYHRAFARMAGVDDHASKGRLVWLAPRLSLTGQNADEWVPLKPGSEAAVALAMAHVIARARGNAGPYQAVLDAYPPARAESLAGVPAAVVESLAERFLEEGPSLALGPGVAGHHRHATGANLAVHVLNWVAGNVGRTLSLGQKDQAAPSRPFRDLQEALAAMPGVGVVVVMGTNPAYSLPPSAGFRQAFASAGFRVAFATGLDETSALCDLILPDRHFLEAWGDSAPRPGVFALQQPAMQPVPLFDSKQAGDVLLSVALRLGKDLGGVTFYDFLRRRWQGVAAEAGHGGPFEDFWREALRKGVVEIETRPTQESPGLRPPEASVSFEPPDLEGAGEFALLVYPSPRFGDGRQANRPWLQELPDPVSKMTWHSWVELNPRAGERLGLRNGDMVVLRSSYGQVEVPVWLYPGIREDVVALAMGGGHEEFGRFAKGKGVNPMVLLPTVLDEVSGTLSKVVVRVSLEPTGVRRLLATTEGSADQRGRPIAPAVSLAALTGGGDKGHGKGHHPDLRELQGKGGFVPVPTEGRPEDFPLEGSRYGEYDPEEKPRWAMVLDLDRCTGCSACVTACQSENNVPWVGEEQVMRGREMHWIRMERYYEAVDASHPGPVDIRFLPMLCQHCGNAPCEPVCPVYAAYHTPEGLNAQVYNRCVGTRYCANNCPYKVRVFNWFTFTDVPEPMNWAYNPDVTVRSSGVMEKCSFCVHRIREAQNRARLEGRRPLQDGEVVTACQQSCPAEAIVFGNIRDPRSRVSQLARNGRAYRVLDEHINTQPAVIYLKKVTFHEAPEGEH